jgi:hypothetical protein
VYGCGTWSPSLRNEHRLKKFDNRVPGIIFGLKRDEIIGHLRKLHDDELHNLYSLPSIIRMYEVKWDELGRAYNTHGEKRNADRILVGKPEEERPLGRSRCR